MATATPQHKKRRRKQRNKSADVHLFGIDLLSTGEVAYEGKVYGVGEGLYAELRSGKGCLKQPFLPAVYFQLQNSQLIAFLYCDSQKRWIEATKYLVPANLSAAVPGFSWQQFVRDMRKENRRLASCWMPCPPEYQLSSSLKFLSGARIEYEVPPGGKTVTASISKLSSDPQPAFIAGVDGPHCIRGKGQRTFNLETPHIRHKERFQASASGNSYDRHCHARQLVSTEKDAWGIRYLEGSEILFADVPVPFRMEVSGRPWSMEVPYGKVIYKHEGFLVLQDGKKKFAERYSSEVQGWVAITTGMWEFNTTWVLAEKALSVTVLDVLELFSDGSCCFLKQYTFPLGVPIDVKAPNRLRLERLEGNEWLSLFEGDECLGMGYFDPQVFHQKEGPSLPSWGWGTEVDLPEGRDSAFEYLLGAALVIVSVLLYLAPWPTAVVVFWLAAWGLGMIALMVLRDAFFFYSSKYLIPLFRIVGNTVISSFEMLFKLLP